MNSANNTTNTNTSTATEVTKPRVAVHKFASCDGCQLAFLNMGPDLLELAELVDIVHFVEAGLVAPDHVVDIAFIEGSVSTKEDIERIHLIRKNSKLLISIGACATSGGLQALRNLADGDQWLAELYPQPQFIQSLKTTEPIKAHVKVDYELWGCPINKGQLLQLIKSLLLGTQPALAKDKLCLECKRHQVVCTLVTNAVTKAVTKTITETAAEENTSPLPDQRSCLGAITATGCGALCPSVGRACYGCYGLSDNPNPHSLALRFEGFGLVGSEIAQRLLMIHSNEKINRQEADHWIGSDHD